MGRLLSKPQQNSTTLLLVSLENNINTYTQKLASTKRSYTTFKINLTLIAIIIIPLSSLHTYKYGSYILFITTIFLVMFYYIIAYILKYRMKMCNDRIQKYRECQKVHIEKLKNENYFNEARQIVARYEDEMNKDNNDEDGLINWPETASVVDRVAQMVLGNDNEKCLALICRNCMVHNGLKKRDEKLDGFVCYKCEYRNLLTD